jgi:MFS family permease
MVPINIAFRLVDADSFWFVLGMFAGYMQLGVLYGPTFATVQELAPPRIRATVIAFFILALNVVGLGIGITVGGFMIDWLASQGVEEPYTWTLLVFSVLSALSIPCFFAAGRRLSG